MNNTQDTQTFTHEITNESKDRDGRTQRRSICSCGWSSTWQPGDVAMAINAGKWHLVRTLAGEPSGPIQPITARPVLAAADGLEHDEEHTDGKGIYPPPAESVPGDALRRYDIAVANAETIGSSGWNTLAMDLFDAAAQIEREHGSVERQRKIRDRARDCVARSRGAERAE